MKSTPIFLTLLLTTGGAYATDYVNLEASVHQANKLQIVEIRLANDLDDKELQISEIRLADELNQKNIQLTAVAHNNFLIT